MARDSKCLLGMASNTDSDCDCCCLLTENCKFGVETHLGGGVMSTFVFLSTAIARAVTSTFVGNTVLRKGP